MVVKSNYMKFKLITNKEELKLYANSILALFERSYGKSLSYQLWKWAYLDNPCGDPVVSLCLNQDSVLGHYAVIPYTLWTNDTPIKNALSMTTMIDPTMQGQGLFTKLASYVYQYLQESNYDSVIGFPNKNSLPGFKKHLQWNISEQDYVAKLTAKQLLDSHDVQHYISVDKVKINENNDEFMDWRLSKPNTIYKRKGNHIFKIDQKYLDLVQLSLSNKEQEFTEQTFYVLLDGSIKDLKKYKEFDYPFGHRCFNSDREIRFKKELLLSDVF